MSTLSRRKWLRVEGTVFFLPLHPYIRFTVKILKIFKITVNLVYGWRGEIFTTL